MKAVILCAGHGKRMKPYTDTYQKTMLPLHGKPLLEYLINGIALAGIREFIIVVGYRKEQIIDYFKDGKNWDVNIEYIEQEMLDGTGGALLLCEKSLNKESFFLTWGDTLATYKIYKDVYEAYKNDGENFILVSNYVDDPYRGAAIYCEGNYCLDIIEKPLKGTSNSNLNNTGIFILTNEIFEVLKTQKPSKRGEIEVPVAVRTGIKERNWRFRVIQIARTQFMGDFGNIDDYNKYKKEDNWLKLL